MVRPFPTPLQNASPAKPPHTARIPFPAGLARSVTQSTIASATASLSLSIVSSDNPLPILKSESVRVFNASRALYIRIAIVHEASRARGASFSVPRRLLLVLDEYHARVEDLRSGAHRLIASVEAEERRAEREKREPDAVVMLGVHGKQVSPPTSPAQETGKRHPQQTRVSEHAPESQQIIPLDILIQELQHLDFTLERLEVEWNRSDICAYWYGPCTIPGMAESECGSGWGCGPGLALTDVVETDEGGSVYSSFTLSAASLQWADDGLMLSPPFKRSPLQLGSASQAHAPGNTGAGAKRGSHPVQPLTPLDMPAPYRPPIRHRSGAASHGMLGKLNSSGAHKAPTPRSGDASYFSAMAFRDWADDEMDVGRGRDVVLGGLL